MKIRSVNLACSTLWSKENGEQVAIWSLLLLTLSAMLMVSNPSYAQSSKSRSRRLTMPQPERKGPVFSNDRFRIEGQLNMGSQYLTDEFNEGASAAFGGSTRLRYEFLETLSINAEAFMRFSAERFQSQFDSDDFAGGINANRFELIYKPIKQLEFGLLGINQKTFIDAPLLVSNRAFPGAYQQINIGGNHKKNWCNCIQLRAGQFIPTSRSFDTDRQEKEQDPFFTTLGVRAVLSPNKHISFQPHYMNYRFENLPSIVAFRSRLRGNTVVGETAPNSLFAFDFEGYVAGADLILRPTRNFKILMGYQAIENESAPETVNSGRLAYLKPSYRWGQTTIKPVGGAYYNEPDTAPGLYNNGDFGHNNREGTFYGLDLDFNKYGFRVKSRIVSANVINKDELNFQTDQTYAVITLETLYVTF